MLLIEDNGTLYTIFDVLTSLIAVVLVGYVALRHCSRASATRRRPSRRAMAPVIWSGVGLLVVLAGSLT